jgi:hypothetical protein
MGAARQPHRDGRWAPAQSEPRLRPAGHRHDSLKPLVITPEPDPPLSQSRALADNSPTTRRQLADNSPLGRHPSCPAKVIVTSSQPPHTILPFRSTRFHSAVGEELTDPLRSFPTLVLVCSPTRGLTLRPALPSPDKPLSPALPLFLKPPLHLPSTSPQTHRYLHLGRADNRLRFPVPPSYRTPPRLLPLLRLVATKPFPCGTPH